MALAPTDQRDLVEALFAGLLERPPWQQFLRRLVARTGSERAGILLRGPGGAMLDTWQESFAVSRDVARARQALSGGSLPPGLRPLRVFSFAELIAMGGEEQQERDRVAFAEAGIAHGRLMRVPATGGWEAWVVLEHSSRDFAAADSALVSDLGPYIVTMVDLMRHFELLRRRTAAAEEGLARLGISQALLDRDRRVIAGDAGQLGAFELRAGGTLHMPGARGGELATALNGLARSSGAAQVVADHEQPQRSLLLRPAPQGDAIVPLPDSTLAATRSAPPGSTTATTALMRLHGLSRREAELALALSAGEDLVPAGQRLGLTPQTTRNYSKRIYAKTGARGQADLVRLILSGLAPLAS